MDSTMPVLFLDQHSCLKVEDMVVFACVPDKLDTIGGTVSVVKIATFGCQAPSTSPHLRFFIL